MEKTFNDNVDILKFCITRDQNQKIDIADKSN